MFSKFKNSKKADAKKEIELLFGLAGEFDRENTQGYKKIASATTQEKATYNLYIYRTQKLKESNNIILYMIDMLESSFSNVVVPTSKNYVFISKDNSDNEHKYKVVAIKSKKEIKKDEVERVASEVFEGYSYKYAEESKKELEKLYLKNNNKLLLAMGLIYLGVGVGAYLMFFQDTEIKQSKPPKPFVKPLSNMDKIYLKHELTIKVLDGLLKEIEVIKKGDKFNNPSVKRITSFNMSNIQELAVSRPYYLEARNKWIFDNEKLKRGGVSGGYSITFQKVFPDVGYKFLANQNGLKVYSKTEDTNFEIYGTSLNKLKDKDIKLKPFTVSCFKDITSLADDKDLTILNRADNTMSISFSKVKASNITKINDIAKSCPITLVSLSIFSTATLQGEFIVYKNKDDKGGSSEK